MTLLPLPELPLKVAMTDADVLSFTLQAALPEQAPDHAANISLVAGFSVKVTAVPVGKTAEHTFGQLIPIGSLSTVPLPAPAKVTFNVSPRVKSAATCLRELSLTLQPPIPEHPPVQPAKTKFWAGVALRRTWVFSGKLAVQVVGQSIPGGLLVIVPEPAAGGVTLN